MRRIKTVRDLKGEAYKSIKEAVLNRSLPPGTQLKESDLEKKLGVSRTPIREALNQLYKDGIIVIYPRQGAFVKNWTKEEVVEVLILREVLEGVAVRLGVKHLTEESVKTLEEHLNQYENGLIDYAQADERFHNDIIQSSRSPRVIELFKNLMDSLEMMDMRRVIFRYPERIKESMTEHLNIIKAIRAKDERLAEQLIRDHFQRTRAYYESHLNSMEH